MPTSFEPPDTSPDLEAQMALGRSLVSAGRIKEALTALNAARGMAPKSNEPTIAFLKVAINANDREAISEASHALLAGWGEDPRALTEVSRGFRKLRRFVEAAEVLERISRLRPQDVKPLLQLVTVRLAIPDVQGAVEAAALAVERAPTEPAAHLGNIAALAALSDMPRLHAAGLRAASVAPAAANQAASALLKIDEACLAGDVLARVAAESRDIELSVRTIKALEKVLRGGSEEPTRVLLAVSLLGRLDPTNRVASSHVRALVVAARDRARTEVALGDLDGAIRTYEDAFALDPTWHSLLEEAARVLERAKDYQRAANLWLRAAQLDGKQETSRRAARAAHKAGDVDLELAALSQLLKADPEDEEAKASVRRLASRAVRLMRDSVEAGRDAEALHRAQALLRAIPEEERARRVVRQVRASRLVVLREARRSGNLEDMERHARALLEADPEAIDGLRVLATVGAARGELAEACRQLERLLATKPDDAPAKTQLARLQAIVVDRREQSAV